MPSEPIEPQVGKIVGPSELTGGERIWMADPEPIDFTFDVLSEPFQTRFERDLYFDLWIESQVRRPHLPLILNVSS